MAQGTLAEASATAASLHGIPGWDLHREVKSKAQAQSWEPLSTYNTAFAPKKQHWHWLVIKDPLFRPRERDTG